jgi:hypothetical protein
MNFLDELFKILKTLLDGNKESTILDVNHSLEIQKTIELHRSDVIRFIMFLDDKISRENLLRKLSEAKSNERKNKKLLYSLIQIWISASTEEKRISEFNKIGRFSDKEFEEMIDNFWDDKIDDFMDSLEENIDTMRANSLKRVIKLGFGLEAEKQKWLDDYEKRISKNNNSKIK